MIGDKQEQYNIMLYIAGSKIAFRCECGCNVFHRIPSQDDMRHYMCNGCRLTYSEATDEGKGIDEHTPA
jgi:hypothetical protein